MVLKSASLFPLASRSEAGPQQSLVPGAGVSGGVQRAAQLRGSTCRRALPGLPRGVLLRLQRAVAGRPRVPGAAAHDRGLPVR